MDLTGGKVIAWNDWVGSRTAPYDDNGHGTHVAGIVAGTGAGNPAYVGVAPGAALVGLKVLNGSGSGSLSNVTAAVDWAVAHRDDYNIRVISTNQTEVTPIDTRIALPGGHRQGDSFALLSLCSLAPALQPVQDFVHMLLVMLAKG
ncbi:MAG TPA: S8 family serine peptidase [Symbiobacteriaceae bacterium]|nr:S8 family serine peptidase [Symbiobacteriaceae bacterium]